MNPFQSLNQRIELWLQRGQGELVFRGIPEGCYSFFYTSALRQPLATHRQLIITASPEEAESLWDELKHLPKMLHYPGLGHSPYSSILSSEASLIQRFRTLSKLTHDPGPCTVITSVDALHLKGPGVNFFREHLLNLKQEDILSPFELAQRLVALGYRATPSVEEPGTFTRKGEIFDLYPINSHPVRLHYFDDLIEKILPMDITTQRTSGEGLGDVFISAAPGIFAREEFGSILRENLPQPTPQFKDRFHLRKEILSQLAAGNLFENYPVYVPLFFRTPALLTDFFSPQDSYIWLSKDRAQREYSELSSQWEDEHLAEAKRNESLCLLPAPEKLIAPWSENLPARSLVIEPLDVTLDLGDKLSLDLHLSLTPLRTHLNVKLRTRGQTIADNKFAFIKDMMALVREEIRLGARLLLVVRSEGSRKEFEFILQENGISPSEHVSWAQFNLVEGFYYRAENLWVISEADLFAVKQKKARKTTSERVDLFAEQLATLKAGDYVVHRDFGIGLYRGLESLKVGDQESDFLVLEYDNRDKVYVPVYRLNLVQKHADAQAGLKVASLQSKKFSEQKNKARQSVKKLAFDLLRLQAERKVAGGFPYSAPDHLFREFELSFPFEETPDQLKAIEDVLDDMQAQYPMDRLVCGDVGFGKTEVAMRAAFKAVLDKKQVAVLVPTTVLALQHFHSFKRRFQSFPVSIEMLSRFKSAKEAQEITARLAEGKVDIVIGTHSLLSEKVEFLDLGLVVIDEEHRFGVNHKEKLKALKQGVDVLTMTATPIPRTMQMAFIGIRDMSIIQTAPPRRQAIKSYLIKEDDLTLKSAIDKELARGGQVFYVHNRVHDIEEHELYLKKLVPKARITITHGQMPEKELEKRINDFIEHRSDILLSTTIIESGIDIPNANTMIIDRADTYGLAQLHQLRGRIGRSDRKAYAYFMVPEHRVLSDIATRRLQALQTYAEMGSGFSLASADLEIRGAGDILGAEQHGHVDQIGLELYMDLLQEAIHELKGEQRTFTRNVEIQAPYNAAIPHSYMPDHPTRLKYYKRLSNANSLSALENLAAEIADAFGLIPKELESLFAILRTRLHLQPLGVRLVKVGQSTVHLYFDQELLESNELLRDKIVHVFLGKPKLYKLLPDSSVQCFFKETVSQHMLLEFAKHVAGQMGA